VDRERVAPTELGLAQPVAQGLDREQGEPAGPRAVLALEQGVEPATLAEIPVPQELARHVRNIEREAISQGCRKSAALEWIYQVRFLGRGIREAFLFPLRLPRRPLGS